jgi:hypothetical protein
LLTLWLGGLYTPALGQETREGQRAAEQAEKAKQLHPYVPTLVERRIEAVEKSLANPPALYPYLGNVFPGGWFAVGPGYRGRYAGSGRFDVHGAWSLRNYKLADAMLRLPEFAGGRINLELRATWIDAPKVRFHGVGNASHQADRTSFLYRSTTGGLAVRIQPVRFFAIGTGLDYLALNTDRGTRGTSIEQRFTLANTPGLGAGPTYRRGHLFAEVDWRESPDYTRSGGFYRVDWFDYRENNDGPYSFRRVDAEVNQFFPILRENWVIALRTLASITDTETGNAVPYFLLPDLGGRNRLRGYPSWRFRDRHRIFVSGEYRWTAGQFVDMALFLDAGKVAARRNDLDLNGLHTSYGIGVRFHTPIATVVRIEVARTRNEGVGLVLAFGQTF